VGSALDSASEQPHPIAWNQMVVAAHGPAGLWTQDEEAALAYRNLVAGEANPIGAGTGQTQQIQTLF